MNISVEGNGLPLDKLKKVFIANKGDTPILFSFKNPKFGGVKVKTANNFSINLSEKALKEVGSLVGSENLSLVL